MTTTPNPERSSRLHVGCGNVALPGWINIDNQPYPAVDQVLDVTTGLPFQDLDFVFAEHFLEHLSFDSATFFLRECRRVLRPDGVLRLSTPNLDWVWITQYHYGQWSGASEAVRDCFWLNKAFRGWGHQFLYNLQTLTECLYDAGFGKVVPCGYGESEHADLQGIERHEKYLDSPDLPHILIVEASGTRTATSTLLEEPRADFQTAVAVS